MMPDWRALLLSGLLLCAARSAGAQAADLPLSRWQHSIWSGDKGPPPDAGEGMQRSNDGYLWMGSPRGLVRFDGVEFTLFDSTNVPVLKGVSGCCYNVLRMGPSGTMWVRGPGSLLLGYRDGRFHVEIPTGSGRYGIVMEDRLGRLWSVGPRLQVFRNGRWEAPPLPPGVPQTGIITVMPDSGNGILISTSHDGIWHVNGDSVEHFGTGWLIGALQSSDGALWTIGINEPHLGIGRLQHGAWSPITLSNGRVRPGGHDVVEGPDGSVWIPTDRHGLLRWRHGVLEHFSTSNGLSGSTINGMHAGVEGAVWLLTDAGLERLRPAEFTFAEPSVGPLLDSFEEDRDGFLWVRDPARPLLRLNGDLVQPGRGPPVVDSVRMVDRGPFTILAASARGGVWIAPENGGLVLLRGNEEHFIGPREGLPRERILAGVEDGAGTLWVKEFDGRLARVRDGRYTKVALPKTIRVHDLAVDALGRLWIGAMGAPNLFMVSDDTVSAHIALAGAGPTGEVTFAIEGRDTFWVNSGNTLYRVAQDRVRAIPLPSLDKLLLGGATLAVSRGQLWLASPSGIARIGLDELHRAADGAPGTISPVIFDGLDGIPIPHTPGSMRSPMRVGRDGRVWIATVGGLAVADGPHPASNPHPPIVHIAATTLNGAPVDLKDAGSLPAHPGEVGIHLEVPDLGLPERIRVEYRLEGADTDWVRATPPYRVSYSGLPPGRYRFRARAWNETGMPSQAEATFSFRVLRAWYESWWFLGLCILGIAGLAAGGTQMLQRGRNQRMLAAAQDRFEAVLAERGRLARELHDTLLQGFTGITLQLDGVRDALAKHEHPLAVELSDILVGADRSLREAREMVWDIRQPPAAELELGESLRAACEALPNPDGIAIEQVRLGTPRPLSPDARTTLVRIGKEATINAIAHSRARTIVVTLCYEPRQVRLEVQDDGRGATPEQLEELARARGHWGLAGMRERARSAGGMIEVVSAPGQGTRVSVSLPEMPGA